MQPLLLSVLAVPPAVGQARVWVNHTHLTHRRRQQLAEPVSHDPFSIA